MTKSDITYQDKFNELMLDVVHPNNAGKAFIFVEGESDIRLFRKLFNLKRCKVECIPGGNTKLEECVEQLINFCPLILGIRDADFIKLSGISYTKANVILTDLHDIEMTLIYEDEVFSAIVFEYTEIPKENHASFRNNILKTIEQISFIKYLNHINDLKLNFEVGFQDLISFANFNIDLNEYFSRVLSKSPNAKILDLNIILEEITQLGDTNIDPFQLSNGHDFIKAFSHFVRVEGRQKSCSQEVIASAFRMNFSPDYFKNTNLYTNTKIWGNQNNCAFHL